MIKMNPTEQEQLYQKNLERIKAFRLLDDIFFNKCFEGSPECIELVLRIVLEMPGLTVLEVHTQVFVENMLNRSVRLDILATDSAGARFNVEIQRSDAGAGQRRARFHSSMLDTHLLQKGEKFKDLPETYVIFITENDVIGYGKPLYRIERWIENIGVRFMDGAHILYVNGEYRGNDPVGKLMHDFSCANPSEMYYDILSDRVKYFKESKKGRDVMCKIIEEMYNEAKAQGILEGKQEGWKEKEKELALHMLRAKKYPLNEIAELSGFTISEIKELQTSEAQHIS